MATPNYGYEKRQRELAKKKKKEEKIKAKTDRQPDGSQQHSAAGGANLGGGEKPTPSDGA